MSPSEPDTSESSPFSPPAVDEARMDVLMHAIAHRRSLGLARLHPHPVEPRLIERALEAANWAPSHGDTEPWRFTVITGEARRALGDIFAEAYRADAEAGGTFRPETYEAQKDRAMSAPVWISLGMEPGRRPDGTLRMTEEDELMAVACAVQNLHLVLAETGLVGMWHSKGVSVHPHVARYLGLHPPARLLGFFFCGWPKVEWPEGERGPLSEKVRWWGSARSLEGAVGEEEGHRETVDGDRDP